MIKNIIRGTIILSVLFFGLAISLAVIKPCAEFYEHIWLGWLWSD